ncbi:cation diffusion facilitator family transporter [Dictyoglomus thermophilum]|uniref:Cobalt/zinc/cadmium cation efflux pump protein n=2 Tax=Dictyoglomus thermophilum TaxID=14 RepID=B5YAS6_DICT6|nr:cation diffusion facilitator family transporter [Dictyoglomus thermophilum]ACI18933.1 cobalt/zinc/cadmium cation efflux pump protein [Dictyoglomus thermophilum H-6-12]MCX7720861.1 cation diffusion facilitator family transporter [Dictyoglomus thermophilum]
MEAKKILGAMFLNFLMALLEVIGGIFSGSLALISDALHNINDFFALLISYLAEIISKNKKSNLKHTFGFRRVEILSALLNGVLLLGVFLFLIVEAFHRIKSPKEVEGIQTVIIGVIGLVGNILGALLLHEDSHHNLNIKGAFLHLISDAISSVGVIIGAMFIIFYKLYIADTIISLLIAGFILYSSIDLIKETLHILMEGTPREVDINEIQKLICKIPGVRDIHHIHVWQVSTKDYLLSAHVVVEDQKVSEAEKIVSQIKDTLREKFNINHSTLEIESETYFKEKECQCEY